MSWARFLAQWGPCPGAKNEYQITKWVGLGFLGSDNGQRQLSNAQIYLGLGYNPNKMSWHMSMHIKCFIIVPIKKWVRLGQSSARLMNTLKQCDSKFDCSWAPLDIMFSVSCTGNRSSRRHHNHKKSCIFYFHCFILHTNNKNKKEK